MKKIVSMILTVVIIVTCSICAFAANAEDIIVPTESDTTISNITEEPENNLIDETIKEDPIDERKNADIDDTMIVSGYGFVSFTLEDNKTIDVIIVDKDGKEYTLEFTQGNNYIVQNAYPVGEYTIKSVTTKNDKYHVKDYSVTGTKGKTFTIDETDFMTIKLSVTIKKEPFIIGFLKREWFLLIILAGLIGAYYYRKTHRILPSQEN